MGPPAAARPAALTSRAFVVEAIPTTLEPGEFAEALRQVAERVWGNGVSATVDAPSWLTPNLRLKSILGQRIGSVVLFLTVRDHIVVGFRGAF